jgi:hypothetical protein
MAIRAFIDQITSAPRATRDCFSHGLYTEITRWV